MAQLYALPRAWRALSVRLPTCFWSPVVGVQRNGCDALVLPLWRPFAAALHPTARTRYALQCVASYLLPLCCGPRSVCDAPAAAFLPPVSHRPAPRNSLAARLQRLLRSLMPTCAPQRACGEPAARLCLRLLPAACLRCTYRCCLRHAYACCLCPSTVLHLHLTPRLLLPPAPCGAPTPVVCLSCPLPRPFSDLKSYAFPCRLLPAARPRRAYPCFLCHAYPCFLGHAYSCHLPSCPLLRPFPKLKLQI